MEVIIPKEIPRLKRSVLSDACRHVNEFSNQSITFYILHYPNQVPNTRCPLRINSNLTNSKDLYLQYLMQMIFLVTIYKARLDQNNYDYIIKPFDN